MEIKPVARIITDFKDKFGLPRQSGLPLHGDIVFEKEYRRPEVIRGLEGYSHIWLIWDFSLSHQTSFSPTVRPPRLGGNTRVGVFASRSPFRPNSLGLTAVKIEKIDYGAKDGPIIRVSGIDMVSGTPVYDIKPYLPHADIVSSASGGYADEKYGYKLTVSDENDFLDIIPEEKRSGIMAALSEDPRPSYQEDGRTYGLNFAGHEIKFTVNGDTLYITDVKKEKSK